MNEVHVELIPVVLHIDMTGQIGGAIALATTVDKGQTAAATVADDDASGATITLTPKGYVQVAINGVLVGVGDGVKTEDSYFSGDAGTTARAIADIVAGDTLHWVGTVAGFELAVTDQIDLFYDV